MSLSGGWMRRMAGMLRARLPELELGRVEDARDARGKRWELPTVLSTLLVALAAGGKSLRDAEALTDEMSKSLRRALRLRGRIADTTLRDNLLHLSPEALRGCLHRQAKAAHRRKALAPGGFPFGVVALDGKSITQRVADGNWAMEQTLEDGKTTIGLVRTITACLVSSASKLCIDAIPMGATSNEVGVLRRVVDTLDDVYGKSGMFRLLTYDAGGCSEENAGHIVRKGYEYLFAVKQTQPQLLCAMRLALESAPRLSRTEDILSDGTLVVRRIHLVSPQMKAIRWGKHAKTFLCVLSQRFDKDGTLLHNKRGEAEERRYFVSSLSADALSPAQWLSLVRHHWAVENACHYTYDVAFAEDDYPWVKKAPHAALCLAILRRIVANMLALLRSSSRSDATREIPWADLIRRIYNFAIASAPEHLEGLRPRKAQTAFL